jgi:hypothetical protein
MIVVRSPSISVGDAQASAAHWKREEQYRSAFPVIIRNGRLAKTCTVPVLRVDTERANSFSTVYPPPPKLKGWMSVRRSLSPNHCEPSHNEAALGASFKSLSVSRKARHFTQHTDGQITEVFSNAIKNLGMGIAGEERNRRVNLGKVVISGLGEPTKRELE